jgi:phosphoribosylformimino-5-aminoimidazole carboxamide ribotide isomerase
MLKIAARREARVQFGGGLRSREAIKAVLEAGVARAVLGTMAVEQPGMVAELIARWGPERVAVSLDARQGLVQVRGWQEATPLLASTLAGELRHEGLRWLIFTDIARDGRQNGINLPATVELAHSSGLDVIASGGVRDWADIRGARQAGLAGIIVGRALYDGAFDPIELFRDEP